MEWCPIDKMTGYFLTKPNKGSNFKIFRDLITGVIIPIDTNNGKQGTERKTKLIKLCKSQIGSGLRDRYHKRPHQCVAD